MTIEQLKELHGEEMLDTVLTSARHGSVTILLQHKLGRDWQRRLWDYHTAGVVEVFGLGELDEKGVPERVTTLRLTERGRELLDVEE